MMFTWGVMVKNHMRSLFNLHSLRFGENSQRKIVKKKYWRLDLEKIANSQM